jgi:hypothetical protein
MSASAWQSLHKRISAALWAADFVGGLPPTAEAVTSSEQFEPKVMASIVGFDDHQFSFGRIPSKG